MPLTKGDSAPDFTLYDHSGKPWHLAVALAEGRVVLLFFPGAFTSVCTTELNTVNNDLARFTEAGAKVVGISTDSPAVLAEYRRVNDLDYPLLSDHDADVAGAYGARYSREEHRLGFSRMAKRASFVIEPDGTIAYADVQASTRDLPNFDAIAAAVRG
jgi:peroxiredoxin